MSDDLDARCENWGRVVSRRRGGTIGHGLIGDWYYRSKSWIDNVSHGSDMLDTEDAWIIEQAWADPRLFVVNRALLAYHYVYRLAPRHACRLLLKHHHTRLHVRNWEGYLEQALADLQQILDGPTRKPLDMVRITA